MSLRARVLVGFAVVAVVLAVGAVVTTRTTERQLLDQIDAELASAGGLQRFERRPGGGGPPTDYFGAILTARGAEIWFAPNVPGEAPAAPEIDLGAARAAAASGEHFTTASSGGVRYRVRAVADRRTGALAVLALPLDDVDDSVDRLVAVEVATTAAVLGVLALVGWWLVHLGVRPLKQMTATASAIAGGDLSRRVPDVASGTEAGELAAALNAMLARIEAAFDEQARSEERLRRFASDASHELRTPLTTIRGYAELYRSGALRDPAELDEAMRRTEQEAARMSDLVEDLLALARLDQRRPLASDPVDLAALARDAARDALAVDPGRPIHADAAGPVVVRGDSDRLRQVLANLLANALAHTDPTTPVAVSAFVDGGEGVMEVADQGPGMAAEVAARAFERFYRGDPSRSRHHGGSGLGLAIVEATVGAHGGRVELDTAVGRGTTVRVRLPIVPSG